MYAFLWNPVKDWTDKVGMATQLFHRNGSHIVCAIHCSSTVTQAQAIFTLTPLSSPQQRSSS